MEVYFGKVQVVRLELAEFIVYVARKKTRKLPEGEATRHRFNKKRIYYNISNEHEHTDCDIPYTGTSQQYISATHYYPYSAVPDDVEHQILAAEHLRILETIDSSGDDILIWHI